MDARMCAAPANGPPRATTNHRRQRRRPVRGRRRSRKGDFQVDALAKTIEPRVERPAILDLRRAPGWLTSILLLAGATALLLFSNGVDTVPLAAWLAPVLLLRFVRTQRPWV